MRIYTKNNTFFSNTYKYDIKSSKNPVELYKMMKLYSFERKEKYPVLEALLNSLNSILTNCKMRLIKDKTGNLLAAYTFKLRKNRLGKESVYIDALVRNRTEKKSKSLMPYIYQDMKNIALENKAKELTLYSPTSDKALQKNYEKLGFKKDERTWITGGYIMRVNINDFLSL